MDPHLLEILVCPLCKGKLHLQSEPPRLVCLFDRLAYPIRDGIPVMLPDEAVPLSTEEIDRIKREREGGIPTIGGEALDVGAP
ncbi:Trm112 family protein [Hydrogenophilus islandicus]